MKSSLILFTLSLVITFQSPLFAQDRMADASPVRVLKAALDLDEEQVAQLRELIHARAAAVKDNAEQIELARQQMADEVKSDAPDAQLIGELVLEVSTLKQEVGQHQRDFQAAFREMLADEQLRKLAQVKRIALMNRAAEVLNHLKLH